MERKISSNIENISNSSINDTVNCKPINNTNCSIVDRETLLRQIMEADFIIKDLNLYLDTHPCCERALCLFDEFQKKSDRLRRLYSESYGPLTISDNLDNSTWQWIRNPWPWERMV